MTRKELEEYISLTYGVEPEYPWDDVSHGVFRHKAGRKWFAIVMRIGRDRLGLKEEGTVDVLNVKCAPTLTAALPAEPGFYPAYHMNKKHWISIALDGSARDEDIRWLLDMSYDMTNKLPGRKVKNTEKTEEEV